MREGRITSQDIEALVDGQLDPDSAARLRRLLDRQPRLQRQYHRLARQKHLLCRWWASLPQTDNRH